MSTEAVIGLIITGVVTVAGFIAWLTKIAYDIGSIKTLLETRTAGHERRLDRHSAEIRDLSKKSGEHDQQLAVHDRRLSALEN